MCAVNVRREIYDKIHSNRILLQLYKIKKRDDDDPVFLYRDVLKMVAIKKRLDLFNK